LFSEKEDKLKSAYSDPNLSLRARGLFAYYLEVGRVLSAEEMSASVPEGRDAIRNAMAELKFHKYIKAVRHQDNSGQWRTLLKFTDDGFSGVLYIDSDTVTSTSDISTSDLNIDTVTNVTVSIGAAPLKENRRSEMAWPGLEENTTPEKPKRGVLDTEDDSGAIGKVSSLKVGGAKLRKTKVEQVAKNRVNVPEEDWTTNDLCAEFYDLLIAVNNSAPNQMNAKHLATWINKRVAEGVDRFSILKGMRMFFGDPRMFHDIGVGLPIYQRFMKYYGTIHGIVSRVAESTKLDEDTLAHQEKLLKMLEG
jgi:hypothetical protein